MKKITLLLLIQILANTLSFATTWETISEGFWDNPSIWLNGEIPPTTSSDTFLIKHPIVVTEDLTFESGAYMLIETDGGICGHHKASVLNSAKITTYGILELDDLYINSGFVDCLGGTVLLTTSAIVTGTGAMMNVTGAMVIVGTWFECILPNYAFLSQSVDTEEALLEKSIDVYPNPFTDILTVENPTNDLIVGEEPSEIKIYDLNGQEVFKGFLTDEGVNTFDLGFLSGGLYVLVVVNEEKVYSGKLVKH